MSDKTEEKVELPAPAEAPPQEAQAAVALPAQVAIDKTASAQPTEDVKNQAHKSKKFVSAGWRIHNEITYRAIDWLLNSSIGVAFTYWQARTKSGEKYFGKPVSGFFKAILKPVLKSEKSLAEGSKWGTMFAGIMAGGFTIIPPMMALENKHNKKKIVRWLDEKVYGKQAVENDPKFEEAYRRIDEEPHKNFTTGIVSRLIAIAPIITAVSIPTANKPLIKYLYTPIGKLSKWSAHAIGVKPGKMLKEGALDLIDGDPKSTPQFLSNWDFLHRTIGFDFGLTIFYAIFHEIAYKTLAAIGMKNGHSHNEGEDKPTPQKQEMILEPSPTMEESGKYTATIQPKNSSLNHTPTTMHTDRLSREPDQSAVSPAI